MQSSVREITALQVRLDRIEKHNKLLKRCVIMLSLLFVPLFLLGAKSGLHDAQFGQISAEGLTIRDGSGNQLITIGSSKEEGIGISIYNSTGNRVLGIGVPADGKGNGIMVSDAEGRPRIGLGMDDGMPGIALVDTKGSKILAMGGDQKVGYGLLISDSKEVQQIGLGFRDGNAGIMLYDKKGQYVRGLVRQQDGLHYASHIDDKGAEVFE
ncbi:hypothetical protein [Desulfosediminicola flagellatus]|uniref:hypothetical protein n=1 Tax=Desulfosediminicola flagellatus TaxID=2569541 RepID=UPI0010AD0442|nr:hypothetical protein [Desulfosediminicola flagellatus]